MIFDNPHVHKQHQYCSGFDMSVFVFGARKIGIILIDSVMYMRPQIFSSQNSSEKLFWDSILMLAFK